MSKKPLHYWLPDWAHSSLKTRKCSQCKKKYHRQDIVAVGIRESKEQCSMYIEHKCSSCNYRAVTTLGAHGTDTLEEMCFMLLEGIKQKKITEKSKFFGHKNTGTMTDKEVSRFLNFVRKVPTHEDFMKEIGIPTNQNDEDEENEVEDES